MVGVSISIIYNKTLLLLFLLLFSCKGFASEKSKIKAQVIKLEIIFELITKGFDNSRCPNVTRWWDEFGDEKVLRGIKERDNAKLEFIPGEEPSLYFFCLDFPEQDLRQNFWEIEKSINFYTEVPRIFYTKVNYLWRDEVLLNIVREEGSRIDKDTWPGRIYDKSVSDNLDYRIISKQLISTQEKNRKYAYKDYLNYLYNRYVFLISELDDSEYSY